MTREIFMMVRLRVPTEAGFSDSRRVLRKAVVSGLAGAKGIGLVSLSPLPADGVIRRRKSPVRPEFPLLRFMELD